LWIFLGAPYVETLRGQKALSSGLSAITAAVVGVVLNLAVWFALHVWFAEVREMHFGGVRLLAPTWSTFDPLAALIAVGAFVAMFFFKRGMITTLAASTAVGALAYYLLGRA
jgi:chromate transporter